MRVEGKIVDLAKREIYAGSVTIQDGRISKIKRHATDAEGYIMAGFIDAHLHIESSMLTPEEFGRMVIQRGTVAVVTDPHEIANVMGVDGVEFMMRSAAHSPIKCNFTIPSCVPATPFDVAGGEISAADIEAFAASGRFVGLSEVMNVPAVLFADPEMSRKLTAAKVNNLAIDGHAPSLSGNDLATYAASGITTDHECTTIEEAREKISHGMKILIREGSAAKNYNTLKDLIKEHPESVIFCTDDSHSEEIREHGHIDKIVRRAVADGYDLFDTLRIASLNAIEHYKLDCGALREGDPADFIVVSDLTNFQCERSYINGELHFDRSATTAPRQPRNYKEINNFNHDPITPDQLRRGVSGEISVIGILPNEILTTHERYTPSCATENLECDMDEDIAKIVYINRYNNSAPVVEYCRGYGIKRGAIASSISHDSHNMVAIGSNDTDLCRAINCVIEARGGLATSCGNTTHSLPLPIGGIMSDRMGDEVADRYIEMLGAARELGTLPHSPFMTLSFMSLVVIPEVKIGEGGLFAYSKFNWI